MKNLILLFLVIGAAVSTAVTLTNTTGDYLWTLTYATPATGSFYSFVVTYTRPTRASTAGDPLIAASQFIGVACFPTISTFAFTTAVARPAFIFSATTTDANPALNNADTKWGPLVLNYFSGALYTTGASAALNTGAAAPLPAACALVGATKPVLANGIATWTFTIAAACVDLPQMGTAHFAKCIAIGTQAESLILVEKAITAATVFGAMDVTFPGTTTTCATAGASTFATGATILAGIAYLQF
jgi:hypothetical protein